MRRRVGLSSALLASSHLEKVPARDVTIDNLLTRAIRYGFRHQITDITVQDTQLLIIAPDTTTPPTLTLFHSTASTAILRLFPNPSTLQRQKLSQVKRF